VQRLQEDDPSFNDLDNPVLWQLLASSSTAPSPAPKPPPKPPVKPPAAPKWILAFYVSNWVWLVFAQLGLLWVATLRRHTAGCDRGAAAVLAAMLIGVQIGIYDAYNRGSDTTNQAVQACVLAVPMALFVILVCRFFCGK
jgi:hypothetical protein